MADEYTTRDPSHDYKTDPVWGDLWNPEPNVWSPTDEPLPQYGIDVGQVEYQEHTDLHTTAPMSEAPANPAASATVADPRLNWLTEVNRVGPTAPPTSIIQHEVHTFETGSEDLRVRQRNLNVATDSVLPVQLLEENPNRKRALVQLLPTSPAGSLPTQGASTNPTTTSPLVFTVQPGQTWTLQSLAFQYNADAVVANRIPQVIVKDPTGRILFEFTEATAITASQSIQYSLGPGMPYSGHVTLTATTFSETAPMPALVLVAGSTVTISAIAADAADSISGANVQYQLAATTFPSTAVVYIGPRDESSSAASASWYKLIAGAPPLELKTQSGVDVVLDPGTVFATVQVIEELQHVQAQQKAGIV